MSDDPTIERGCTPPYGSPYTIDTSRYHYVIVEAVSATLNGSSPARPLTASTFPVQAYPPTDSWSAFVTELQPATAAVTLGMASSGQVTIDAIGSTVDGSFTASGFQSGGTGPATALSGTFVATSCPPLTMFEGVVLPCIACSYGTGGGTGAGR